MTALVIIASVILLIVLLLNCPVTVHVSFYDRRLKLTVKYLGIPLFPKREKAPRRKKKQRRKKPPKAPLRKSSPEENEEIFEDIAEIGLSDTEPETGEENVPGNVPPQPVETAPESAPEISQAQENETADNSVKPGEPCDEPDEPSEQPGKKIPGKRKKSQKKKSPEEAENKSLSGIIESLESKKDAAALLWELCGGRVKRLLGKVRITGLVIDFAAAHEDAAKAAVGYGALCTAFYDMLGTIMAITPVGISSVKIDCLYNTPSERSRYDCEAKIRLRPASVLSALVSIAGAYLTGMDKYKPALEEFTGK